MRLHHVLIQSFLFIYFSYCHDLNHADPGTIKQSESSVTSDTLSKHIETKNIQRNEDEYAHDTVEARFRATHDLRKPGHQDTILPVGEPSQDQVPVSIRNDFISPSTHVEQQQILSSTKAPSINEPIKDIPISDDKFNPKVIDNDFITPAQTQTNAQPSVDTIQQKRLEENIPSSQKQSHQEEQVKSISDHTLAPPDTQQPVSNILKNSNSLDLKADQHSQSIETIANDASTVQTPPPQNIRSTTAGHHHKAHIHPRHVRTSQQQAEKIPSTDVNQSASTTIEQSNDGLNHSNEPSSPDLPIANDTVPQGFKSADKTDLPRQVRVHDSTTVSDAPNTLNISSTKDDSNKSEKLIFNQEIENDTMIASFLNHDTKSHLPRIYENEDKTSTIDSITETMTHTFQTNNNETSQYVTLTEPKIEEVNKSTPVLSNSDKNLTSKNRQVCWRLPTKLEPSIELLENQILRFINVLPDFVQTIFFGRIDDREVLMNTMWFGSICTMCFLFSFLFLSMGTKRLRQSKHEKEIRARCQQLQQDNNQIELERATFERQNQKLSDEIDEVKNIPVRDTDEDIFELREECTRLHDELKSAHAERDGLQQDIDYKHNLLQKHEYDTQRQVEIVAHLNNEILQFKQELEKERRTISQLQSNDLSIERFEKFQEIIHQLKSEISQLKQDKFTQVDRLQELNEHSNQLDIKNNQLTLQMKQMKNLLEQRDQTLLRIREKINDENITGLEDLLSILEENNDEHLFSTINNDIEIASQHIRDLHNEIREKTDRIKEIDLLFKQEKDRCREIETKLKVVLELRERDAHLHIRQLGQTDAELRKARTDTERVRILQQQLELKQQQLDDVQKVLSTEQTKFSEECSKLQHDTHEKWMEVKRLTREFDASRKECEGLRKQITKYANNERSAQEKAMLKPVLQHIGNSGRISNEPQSNGSSPPPPPVLYHQGDKSIDEQRNDSGTASPTNMFMPRPPHFGLPRLPYFPQPPFLPPPQSNPFLLHPRYSMPATGPHGMISPIAHLVTNGSNSNSFEIVDSENITPNSTSYDAQPNGAGSSSILDDDQQGTTKAKKPKKSLKKKTRTSTAAVVKEDV